MTIPSVCLTKRVVGNFLAIDATNNYSAGFAAGSFSCTSQSTKSVSFPTSFSASNTGTKYTVTPVVVVTPCNYSDVIWSVDSISSTGFTIWSSKTCNYKYIAFGAA